jgi:hypothetical protein
MRYWHPHPSNPSQHRSGLASVHVHSSSLPVIFNVASQILRRWLLQRSNHLVSSACTAACICTYSVSFYSSHGSLPFPYDRLPRLCTRFLNACLTLHATLRPPTPLQLLIALHLRPATSLLFSLLSIAPSPQTA